MRVNYNYTDYFQLSRQDLNNGRPNKYDPLYKLNFKQGTVNYFSIRKTLLQTNLYANLNCLILEF
jgi:hypothetical protein